MADKSVVIEVGIKRAKISPLPKHIFEALFDIFAVRFSDKDDVHLLGGTNQAPRFYSGILEYVKKELTSYGYDVEVNDKRPKVEFDMDYVSDSLMEINRLLRTSRGFVLRPYQIDTIDTLLSNSHGAVQIATGGGKTLIIASLIRMYNLRTVMLVDSVDLMNQAAEELALVIPESDIGKVGAGIDDPRKVTVAIVKSAIKHPTLLKEVEYIVADEAHLAAANQFRNAILNSSAYVRHGFTGTYTRTERKELKLLYCATGSCLRKISCTELIEGGYLPRPYITIVRMPKSKVSGIPGNVRDNPWARNLMIKKCIVDNEIRNKVGCEIAHFHYQEDRKIMIFVTRIQHGNIIKNILLDQFNVDLSDIDFVHNKSGKRRREEAMSNLDEGRTRILIATKIFEKGINIPNADVGINLKGEYTEIGAKQTIGRLLRGIEAVYLYDFMDSGHSALTAYSKHRVKQYCTEEAYLIRDVEVDQVLTLPGIEGYEAATQAFARRLSKQVSEHIILPA